jgi:S-DNA-T family DNA segregation ATPase FtsK/SpoIIIE
VNLADTLAIGPWLILAATIIYGLLVFGIGPTFVTGLIRRDAQLRRSAIQAATVRRGWSRLARNLGLALVDRTAAQHTPGLTTPQPANTPAAKQAKHIVPKVRVRPDPYGLVVDITTVPGVGLVEIRNHAQHLADAWGCVRVAVTQPAPGAVRVRAVRRDPLIERTTYEHTTGTDLDIRNVYIGTDEYAAPVNIRLDGVAGIGIYGLPGYGKTSLMLGLISRLAPHPGVQFLLLDGKADDPADGDYGPVIDRFAVALGDDLDEANSLLTELSSHRRHRAANIRTTLGTANMWHKGPSVDWPLLILIIDEANTFFVQVKDGGDKTLKARNALAAQNATLVEDLVKKGRSVGILVILLTQKGTGDAIPTAIRDVCAVSLAFACRTIDAAVAALGDDIRNHPDANPVALMDEAYIGVASMIVQGRPGYTRVRMPYIHETTAADIIAGTRELVPAAPRELLSTRTFIRQQIGSTSAYPALDASDGE